MTYPTITVSKTRDSISCHKAKSVELSPLLVLQRVELLQLGPMLLLHPVDHLPDERHGGAVLRRREAVLDGQREEEGQRLGGHHLLRQAQLLAVQGHLVDACGGI